MPPNQILVTCMELACPLGHKLQVQDVLSYASKRTVPRHQSHFIPTTIQLEQIKKLVPPNQTLVTCMELTCLLGHKIQVQDVLSYASKRTVPRHQSHFTPTTIQLEQIKKLVPPNQTLVTCMELTCLLGHKIQVQDVLSYASKRTVPRHQRHLIPTTIQLEQIKLVPPNQILVTCMELACPLGHKLQVQDVLSYASKRTVPRHQRHSIPTTIQLEQIKKVVPPNQTLVICMELTCPLGHKLQVQDLL